MESFIGILSVPSALHGAKRFLSPIEMAQWRLSGMLWRWMNIVPALGRICGDSPKKNRLRNLGPGGRMLIRCGLLVLIVVSTKNCLVTIYHLMNFIVSRCRRWIWYVFHWRLYSLYWSKIVVRNGTRPNLAHIALRWMVREVFKAKAGMMFDPAEIRAIGLDPDALYPVVKPRPAALEPTSDMKLSSSNTINQPNVIVRFGSWLKSFVVTPKEEKPDYSIYGTYNEEQLDLVDALAPVYDQLALKPAKWALLEVLPMKVLGFKSNFGYGRTIPAPFDPMAPANADIMRKITVDPRWTKVRVHRTVKTRMACSTADGKERYVPRASVNGKIGLDQLNPGLIKWVDWRLSPNALIYIYTFFLFRRFSQITTSYHASSTFIYIIIFYLLFLSISCPPTCIVIALVRNFWRGLMSILVRTLMLALRRPWDSRLFSNTYSMSMEMPVTQSLQ